MLAGHQAGFLLATINVQQPACGPEVALPAEDVHARTGRTHQLEHVYVTLAEDRLHTDAAMGLQRSDKVLADGLEALVGAFLVAGGEQGARAFLQVKHPSMGTASRARPAGPCAKANACA
jgi:hypothetical protein